MSPYLVDKSALSRMPLEPVRHQLTPIIEGGEAATCSIIDLEVLDRARSFEEHRRTRDRRRLANRKVPMTEEIFQRAIDVQGYDIIAEVTGQATEWVVPRGSL